MPAAAPVLNSIAVSDARFDTIGFRGRRHPRERINRRVGVRRRQNGSGGDVERGRLRRSPSSGRKESRHSPRRCVGVDDWSGSVGRIVSARPQAVVNV